MNCKINLIKLKDVLEITNCTFTKMNVTTQLNTNERYLHVHTCTIHS